MSKTSTTHAARTAMAITAAMLLGSWSVAAGDAWMTDYDAAVARAAKETKDLLVDFSGSDWCGWCIKLDDEVFGREAFVSAATNHFVLVMLDFPRKPENKAKISEALAKRNDELKTEFGIRGFPSVLLIGADGKPYARTGYQPGGVESYLKHLEKLRTDKVVREEIKAKLDDAQGLERAKLLDELIEATQEALHGSMIEEMKEIVSLDADDAAGLKSKYALKSQMLAVSQAQRAGEFDKAETMYKEIIATFDPQGEQLQDLYFQWGEIKFRQNDKPGIVALLTKALEAAPDSDTAPRLKSMIKRFSPKEEAEAKPDAPVAE